jgi:hypothetical protein
MASRQHYAMVIGLANPISPLTELDNACGMAMSPGTPGTRLSEA